MIKYITKDIDEQPDEEVPKVRSGRVLSREPSVLMDLRCTTLLGHGCVYQLRSSPNPILRGFLWRLYHVDMISYNSVSSPASLSREGRVG